MVNNVMASSIYVYLLVSIYQKMEWGFKGQGVITVNRLWELGQSLIFSVTISVMLPRSFSSSSFLYCEHGAFLPSTASMMAVLMVRRFSALVKSLIGFL